MDREAKAVGGRARSFLVVGEERQFQGNAGYEDVVEESYSYDSTVGNHRRVAGGIWSSFETAMKPWGWAT